MVACILGGATAATLFPGVSLLSHKSYSKPSQLHYFTTAHHFRFPKIRAFSIASRGRAEIRAFSIGGADVRNDKFNHARRPIQALSADINGLPQVSDYSVYVSPKKNQLKSTLKSFLEKGKVAAIFPVKVSFWIALAGVTAIGLSLVAFVYPVLILYDKCVASDKSVASQMLACYRDLICQFCSGRVIKIIFSYVFGDGDPNKGVEEKMLEMIRQYIALNGAVVTAEEIAPYLDPKTTENMNDESYMLPVLQLFNGHPEVDEKGNILYHFPSVHSAPIPKRGWGKEFAGRWVYQDIQVDKFFKETEWEFRKGDAKDVELVEKLIYYNLIHSMLAAFMMLSLGSYNRNILFPLHTMFVIYAASFLTIASLRQSFIQKINAKIIKRNEARERRAKALELPDRSLKCKLESARAMAWQLDYERRELDRRFKMNWE